MKIKKAFLVIILLAFILLSCEKEMSTENGNPPGSPTPAVDSGYVSKIYYIEVAGTISDTSNEISYTYDIAKRVSSLTLRAWDTIIDPYKKAYFYSYQGADTLPFKSMIFSTSVSPLTGGLIRDTTLTFHFFDASGRNLKDSTIRYFTGGIGTQLSIYSYVGNKVMGSTTSNFINIFPAYKDTASLDANGNIVSSVSYAYDVTNNNWFLHHTSSFTHSNVKSPFARLSNFKTFGVFPSGETLLLELPHFNNFTTQDESLASQFIPHVLSPHMKLQLNNIYQTNGLLKEIIFTDLFFPSPYTDKVTFIYKAL